MGLSKISSLSVFQWTRKLFYDVGNCPSSVNDKEQNKALILQMAEDRLNTGSREIRMMQDLAFQTWYLIGFQEVTQDQTASLCTSLQWCSGLGGLIEKMEKLSYGPSSFIWVGLTGSVPKACADDTTPSSLWERVMSCTFHVTLWHMYKHKFDFCGRAEVKSIFQYMWIIIHKPVCWADSPISQRPFTISQHSESSLLQVVWLFSPISKGALPREQLYHLALLRAPNQICKTFSLIR